MDATACCTMKLACHSTLNLDLRAQWVSQHLALQACMHSGYHRKVANLDLACMVSVMASCITRLHAFWVMLARMLGVAILSCACMQRLVRCCSARLSRMVGVTLCCTTEPACMRDITVSLITHTSLFIMPTQRTAYQRTSLTCMEPTRSVPAADTCTIEQSCTVLHTCETHRVAL